MKATVLRKRGAALEVGRSLNTSDYLTAVNYTRRNLTEMITPTRPCHNARVLCLTTALLMIIR